MRLGKLAIPAFLSLVIPPCAGQVQTDREKLTLARVAIEKHKDCRMALRTLESLSPQAQKSAPGVYYLARTHECLGNLEEALRHYRDYDALVPNTTEVGEKISELEYLLAKKKEREDSVAGRFERFEEACGSPRANITASYWVDQYLSHPERTCLIKVRLTLFGPKFQQETSTLLMNNKVNVEALRVVEILPREITPLLALEMMRSGEHFLPGWAIEFECDPDDAVCHSFVSPSFSDHDLRREARGQGLATASSVKWKKFLILCRNEEHARRGIEAYRYFVSSEECRR